MSPFPNFWQALYHRIRPGENQGRLDPATSARYGAGFSEQHSLYEAMAWEKHSEQGGKDTV